MAAFQRDVADLRSESVWMAKLLDALRDLRMLKAWLKAHPVERASSRVQTESLETLMALVGDIGDLADPTGLRGGRRKEARR